MRQAETQWWNRPYRSNGILYRLLQVDGLLKGEHGTGGGRRVPPEVGRVVLAREVIDGDVDRSSRGGLRRELLERGRTRKSGTCLDFVDEVRGELTTRSEVCDVREHPVTAEILDSFVAAL